MKKLSEVSLRRATFSDIEFLWYLRNRRNVYKYSKNNRSVKWEEHINWILPIILGTNNRELFVIKSLKTPIGQIRFDYQNNKKAEVSISILKEFQGKGFAKQALNLVIKKIKKQKMVKILMAEIHKENLLSIKFFKKFNFKLIEKKGDWLKYILEL